MSRWKYRPEYKTATWNNASSSLSLAFSRPVHGFSGNAFVMMRAASMLAEDRQTELYDRIRELSRRPRSGGEYANWFPAPMH